MHLRVIKAFRKRLFNYRRGESRLPALPEAGKPASGGQAFWLAGFALFIHSHLLVCSFWSINSMGTHSAGWMFHLHVKFHSLKRRSYQYENRLHPFTLSLFIQQRIMGSRSGYPRELVLLKWGIIEHCKCYCAAPSQNGGAYQAPGCWRGLGYFISIDLIVIPVTLVPVKTGNGNLVIKDETSVHFLLPVQKKLL
jgi:hypothetical protein